MQLHEDKTGAIAQKDDDIQFDRDNITSTDSQSASLEEKKPVSPEHTIFPNEDQLQTEVVPLSEAEKQPKLDEERIREMNRKTSLGD